MSNNIASKNINSGEFKAAINEIHNPTSLLLPVFILPAKNDTKVGHFVPMRLDGTTITIFDAETTHSEVTKQTIEKTCHKISQRILLAKKIINDPVNQDFAIKWESSFVVVSWNWLVRVHQQTTKQLEKTNPEESAYIK